MSQLIEKAKEAVTGHSRVESGSSDPDSRDRSQSNHGDYHDHSPTSTATISQQSTSKSTNDRYPQHDMTDDIVYQADTEMDSQDEQDIIPGTDHHALHGGRSGKQDTLF